MISRGDFLGGVAGALTTASGGIDVWSPATQQIRVLVAADTAGAMPQVYADGTFAIGGRRWRGAPSTVGIGDGRMALVTTIDVDAYLQGVVPLEVPPSWPYPVLAAQAIVARTYALARRTLSRAYDVRADSGDQQWGGVDAETDATTAAVRATRGRTLTYAGGPADVFYSSCCGGHTADIVAAWGGAPLPYLRGVADPYCVYAPDYRWHREIPIARVAQTYGARTGEPITAATLGAPDDTGRPRSVLLTGATTLEVPVATFRRDLGYDEVRSPWLRSLRIQPVRDGAQLVVEGSGRGHGVGMCQWGAHYLATAGVSAERILAWYFPGTTVGNA